MLSGWDPPEFLFPEGAPKARHPPSFNFEEFRMTLEATIRQLEERARTIRRAQWWGLGIFLFCYVSGVLMQGSGFAVWVRLIFFACGVIAMIATVVLAAVYQYRYAPALTRAKSDLTTTMIAELQQQVADLSGKNGGSVMKKPFDL
jgi:hypothetical protein